MERKALVLFRWLSHLEPRDGAEGWEANEGVGKCLATAERDGTGAGHFDGMGM